MQRPEGQGEAGTTWPPETGNEAGERREDEKESRAQAGTIARLLWQARAYRLFLRDTP
jgi:hypothetical protein